MLNESWKFDLSFYIRDEMLLGAWYQVFCMRIFDYHLLKQMFPWGGWKRKRKLILKTHSFNQPYLIHHQGKNFWRRNMKICFNHHRNLVCYKDYYPVKNMMRRRREILNSYLQTWLLIFNLKITLTREVLIW